MIKQIVLAWVIGISQLVLGICILVIPELFFSAFGFTVPDAGQKYLYGQLAARFFAYGIGMFYIARNLIGNKFWWDMMMLIQSIDLGVGLFYTSFGNVSLNSSIFPMVNAAVFLILLLIWRPRKITKPVTNEY